MNIGNTQTGDDTVRRLSRNKAELLTRYIERRGQ